MRQGSAAGDVLAGDVLAGEPPAEGAQSGSRGETEMELRVRSHSRSVGPGATGDCLCNQMEKICL